MKRRCEDCAWRSYNTAKTPFAPAAYRCLNADSWKHRMLIARNSKCSEFEPEQPQQVAS